MSCLFSISMGERDEKKRWKKWRRRSGVEWPLLVVVGRVKERYSLALFGHNIERKEYKRTHSYWRSWTKKKKNVCSSLISKQTWNSKKKYNNIKVTKPKQRVSEWEREKQDVNNSAMETFIPDSFPHLNDPNYKMVVCWFLKSWIFMDSFHSIPASRRGETNEKRFFMWSSLSWECFKHTKKWNKKKLFVLDFKFVVGVGEKSLKIFVYFFIFIFILLFGFFFRY